jgi:hypothetical protein
MRRGKSWPPRCTGATLVEAVAGTVLLGTLLVYIVLARVQMDSQSRRSQQSVTACRIMDNLMNKWWKDPGNMPRNGQDDVPHEQGWRWRTRSRQQADALALYSDLVTVEVFAPDADDESPAVKIEILLPAEEEDNAQTQPSSDAN